MIGYRARDAFEKKGIRLNLCGVAATADLLAISKGKEKAIPPEGHPALEALAKQRAENIKARLIDRFGATPKQLFICHPDLDRTEGAKARVELSL